MGRMVAAGAAVAMILFAGAMRAEAIDSAGVKAIFEKPPKEYSTVPFWVWNEMMTDELVLTTLRDLAGQGIKQVFVHPRPGLMTPYLSDEWFRLWKVAMAEAERLDMNIWIYDENSYPSGFAGGFVPDAMPESRAKGLGVSEGGKGGKTGDSVVGVFRVAGENFEDMTGKAKAEEAAEANCIVFSVKQGGISGWYGGKFYVDLIKPGVTEKFLDITVPPYKARFGAEFGKRIPAIFTDEPQINPAGQLPWTDDLPEVFEKRWGYSLLDNLPCLARPVGDWKKVRHNYYQTLLDLFIERWAKPYYEYCEREGLEFTGHYWEHEWPTCTKVPDNMAMSAWQQRPGIDILFNQYSEDVHGQFGNIRSAMEIASVANQLGRKRTLVEIYGGGGWDLRFEDMKRIGDWLSVLGINTLNEHLSYVTIRGARKADYPQSFSYHEPWWEAYHVSERYFARLSAALSQGEQVNTILVLEPTTTAWMYNDGGRSANLNTIGSKFQGLVTTLAKRQVEFDIGCEDVIGRNGSVEGAALKVGRREYTTIVLPPLTENLNGRTAELLAKYLEAGGEVLCCGDGPKMRDGAPSEECAGLAESSNWKKLDADSAAEQLLARSKDGFAIRAEPGEAILLHHRRKVADGDILFMTNTSNKATCRGVISAAAKGIEKWDAETGEARPYAFKAGGSGAEAAFEIAPCGSLLLFLSNNAIAPAEEKAAAAEAVIEAKGQMKAQRVGPNVLTLDYADVTVGSQRMERVYYNKAASTIFARYGLDGNPWDHQVQFKDELITKKFAADSGFEATYRFTIEKKVPKSLSIVIERADLYAITCNGKKVAAKKGQWWLDRAFGRIDIRSAAKVGENAVTIKAQPMTMWHEFAAAYVVGDFGLKAGESGFVIVPGEPLEAGKWNEQGCPLYADGVSYSQKFNVRERDGSYTVRLGEWYGSIAKVNVNGKLAGYIWHQPWGIDVTEFIRKGSNKIEVIVIGTLKNTLGPHHASPAIGIASPDMFRKAPASGPPAGEKYHTVAYGLFEPFELTGG